MLRSRFLWKSFAGYGAVLLLTLALVGELVSSATEAELRAKTESLLRAMTGSVAEQVRESALVTADATGGAELQDLVGSASAASGLRIAVVSPTGEVLADSYTVRVRGANVGAATEILAARREEYGWAERLDANGDSVLTCARRVENENGLSGFVRASTPIGAIVGQRSSVTRTVIIAAMAALLATFVLVWFHARVVERPIEAMTRSVDAMASGDFSRRSLVHENDTVGALASSLNRLAAASRERMDVMATDRNKVVAILASVVEGVVAVDASERVVHMNQAAARILGTQSARAQGRRVWEVTRLREVSDMLGTALRAGEEQKREVRVVAPPRDRWVELRTTPLHDADSAIVGAVLMLYDVTELRRLEAIRREFVANVSHELKTPISAIRGLIETVVDDTEMEPEVRQRFLGKIKNQSLRLSQLVTDLLTLSRLESVSQLGELAILDLRNPVRESVQAFAPMAEDRGIAVDLTLPERPVKIMGEAESLRLVVNNLVDNALKYSPEGGHVWIRLRTAGHEAVLEVEDDGIGIEPKHVDRIFQRFYRVDKARSRALGGTGLGLSIVKHVCIAHGGEVTVRSTPGGGSTFTVTLPVE